MKIDVLSVEGLDAAAEGWRLSRDESKQVDWNEVYTVDVPVNEFPTVMLNFRDFTIVEREVFATPRNHVMWARTSHVDDPLQFKVPDIYRGNRDVYEELRAQMYRDKALGRSQDEWRAHLPVVSTTSWTTRMSYRDVIKMIAYMEYLGNSAEIMFSLRFFEIKKMLSGIVTEFFTKDQSKTEKAVASFQHARFLSEAFFNERNLGKVNSTDGFYGIFLEVPLWLRAQIVRHRNIGFVDDFWQRVLVNPHGTLMTIDEKIHMEIAVTKEFWKTIMSKRSCWLAQDTLAGRKDPWQVILDQFGFRDEMLPCADGKCPYSKDASLRLTDADPGTPCPMYCDIAGVDKTPYIEEMRVAAVSRASFWTTYLDNEGSQILSRA